MGRSLEVYTGRDGQRYDIVRPEPEGPITIQPWPFLANQFTVSVEASLLEQLQFQNDAELAAALREAPISLITWEFKK